MLMSERAYTLSEVDRMRAIVRQLHPGRGPGITSFACALNGYVNPDTEYRQNANRWAWESACEEKLRTYMLAGVGSVDLERQLAEQQALAG